MIIAPLTPAAAPLTAAADRPSQTAVERTQSAMAALGRATNALSLPDGTPLRPAHLMQAHALARSGVSLLHSANSLAHPDWFDTRLPHAYASAGVRELERGLALARIGGDQRAIAAAGATAMRHIEYSLDELYALVDSLR